jgi:SH3 domain protein
MKSHQVFAAIFANSICNKKGQLISRDHQDKEAALTPKGKSANLCPDNAELATCSGAPIMTFCRAASFALLAILLIVGPVTAENYLYVTDKLQVTVRTGPSVENKVLHLVKSGDRVAVLETNAAGWAKVRVAEDKEGWMLSRYLQEEKPAILRIKDLDPQAKDLMQRVEELEQENRELQSRQAQAEKLAQETEEKYQALKEEAAQVISLRSRHNKLQTEFEAQAQKLEKVTAEAESLRLGNNLKWFLAGAGVLVVGWLMGLALGRRKKRWSSSLY